MRLLLCLAPLFAFHVCYATAQYGIMLEQHAESAWEQQFNMRVDVIARMVSSFAASGRSPVEPIMRFAIQNNTWWEVDKKSLSVEEFRDVSVTADFNKSFLGVVQHSLGEFFDISYLNSVLPTGFVSHDSWMEQCEKQLAPDSKKAYCVIHRVLWAARVSDTQQNRCHPDSNVVLTSGLDLKFLAREVICVNYSSTTREQLQNLLNDPSKGTVAFYRWDHLTAAYQEPNHAAFRFSDAMLSGPLLTLEAISKCTELDDSGCDSCVVNRGHHYCDVAAYHWRRGDRHSSSSFLPAYTEYLLTMPVQASRFLKAELSKRNIRILYLATNSGKMEEIQLLRELLHPIRVYVPHSSEWDTAIIGAVSDMVIAAHAGFFIMGPGLRGSYLEGVSTFSRRIMLERIHHLGRDDSHFAVCCGDLTSIKVFSPRNGQVYKTSASSFAFIEIEAVVLNPLQNSSVFVRVEDSIGRVDTLSMSIMPGTGKRIQSGRVLDASEPDNMAFLWTTGFYSAVPGKLLLTVSASISMHFLA